MNSQIIIRDDDVGHTYNCANGFVSRCVAAVHSENHSDARMLARLLNDHFNNASGVLQNDLGEMLRALGMSDAAQPKSPHDVFQSALAEMKRQIANASAEPELNWQLSEETKARIAEINDNLRNAALNASNIVAGSSNASAEVRLRSLYDDCCKAVYLSGSAIPDDDEREILDGIIARIRSLFESAFSSHASAEARLREALESARRKFRKIEETEIWTDGSCLDGYRRSASGLRDFADMAVNEIDEAISAHPHASDCDKQGTTTFNPVLTAEHEQEVQSLSQQGRTGGLNPPTGANSSDRTTDVTLAELTVWVANEESRWDGAKAFARALLDTFTVGKRLGDKQGER